MIRSLRIPMRVTDARRLGVAIVSPIVVGGVMLLVGAKPSATVASAAPVEPVLIDLDAGLSSRPGDVRVGGPERNRIGEETLADASTFGPFRAWDVAIEIVGDATEEGVIAPDISALVRGPMGPRVVINGVVYAKGAAIGGGWSVVSIEPESRVAVLMDPAGRRYRRSLALPALAGPD